MRKALLLVVLLPLVGGCGTLVSMDRGKFGAYSGLGVDFKWMGSGDSDFWSTLLGIVDLPFSFVADTVLLPISGICGGLRTMFDGFRSFGF